ncbi:hypothetical protein HNQ07_004221 [Deinococcus metalli]|uniref:Secreted protein n=1 Tax=Deinococcus metalli TaxID=1141878 RepID=A0A7W8KI86_9DEIO|nr:hypothetical protein [Deinococcus metalli]MBB5378714.1 hypothetical protein [Deinococcus metalli]GHF60474.1 hypothetical protein GCM10017781_40840 [Deinococcus metalli]
MLLRLFLTLSVLHTSALASALPAPTAPLVGTSASFARAPICRTLGCVYQGVRRFRLEGSNNPMRVYRYRLTGGTQVEVTRFDLPGQSGDGRVVTVRAQGPVTPRGARTAALLATAASGRPVSAAQVTACWRQTSSGPQRFLVSGSFEAPSVLCGSQGRRGTLLVTLTN